MADERTDAEKEVVSSVEDEVKRIQDAGLAAREEAGHDEGETEEEYRERIANVPGIFGDTDTTAGSGASGTDVVSANNEQATATAAAVEAKGDAGDGEAADATNDEGRRQSDVAADAVPSAEEVDAAADDKDSEDKDEDSKPKSSRRAKK